MSTILQNICIVCSGFFFQPNVLLCNISVLRWFSFASYQNHMRVALFPCVLTTFMRLGMLPPAGHKSQEYLLFRLQLKRGLFWYEHHRKMHEMVSDRSSRAEISTDFRNKKQFASFVIRKMWKSDHAVVKNAKK